MIGLRTSLAGVLIAAAVCIPRLRANEQSPAKSAEPAREASVTPAAAGEKPVVAKTVLGSGQIGERLPLSDVWHPYDRGFVRQADAFFCDNSHDARAHRGVSQTVELNQVRPEPIIASCESKAEGVTGAADADYSIYLDLIYTDGTPLWGRATYFSIRTHDWQRRQIMVLPEKPVKQLVFYMLFRGHGGKAWFRAPELRVVRSAAGACVFDGLPVTPAAAAREGFQLRDVAAASDFVSVSQREKPQAAQSKANVLGIDVACATHEEHGATFSDVDLADTTGKDRAVTLVFAVPLAADGLRWWVDPRRNEAVEAGREYVNATQFQAGSNGRLSRYPLAAVTNSARRRLRSRSHVPRALRMAYNAGTGELYLAYDLGLAAEKPRARLRFCRFTFPPEQGFRGALRAITNCSPMRSAAAFPSKAIGCPLPRSARCKAGRISASVSKRGMMKPPGTTRTASSHSATPSP